MVGKESKMETEAVDKVEEEVSDFQPTNLDDLFVSKPSVDVPADEVQAQEGKVDDADKTETETVEETQTETVDGTVEKPSEDDKEQEQTQNWDDDANPWKATATQFEQRYKNTQIWGNKAHQKLREYGLEDEPEPTEQDRAVAIAFTERERASYAAASQIYGKEYIDKMLYAADAPLKAIVTQNPQMFNRILTSDAPVLESIRVIKENEFFTKYGSDVEKIPDVIKNELEGKLRAEITKELQSKITKKEKMPNTLSGVQSKEVKQDTQAFSPTPLGSIFG